MKHITFFKLCIAALLGIVVMSSCKELSLSDTKIVLDGHGGGSSKSITIKTSESWIVEVDTTSSWIHVSRNGGNGTGDLVVSADCHYKFDEGTRYGTVTIKTAKNFYTIEVSQNIIEENGDLGLSVIWDIKNVGASSSSDYGNYYTFEEAKNIKNDGWRTPTEGEFKELLDNCDGYGWVTKNGTKGRVLVSKINGNAIFLPAAGLRYGTDGYHVDVGSDGFYWSSTAFGGRVYYLHLRFYSDDAYVYGSYSGGGQSVRLVRSL